MKLLSGPLSMFGMKAEIAVAEKGIACDVELVPFTLFERYKPLHPDVERVNPKRQVPVLIDGDLEIFDSTQIFEYLEDRFPAPALWPREAGARARARRAELHADEIFFPHFIALMRVLGDRSKPEADAALRGIAAEYRALDGILAGQAHVAGETFTYADIAWFCASFFTSFLGDEPEEGLVHVHGWRKRVAARPAVAPLVSRFSAYLAENRMPVPRI